MVAAKLVYYAPRSQRDGPRVRTTMVDVAQLVELRIVIPAVVGSNPIVHPIPFRYLQPVKGR